MNVEKIIKHTVVIPSTGSRMETIQTESRYYFVHREFGAEPKYVVISEEKYNKILGTHLSNIAPKEYKEEVEHG